MKLNIVRGPDTTPGIMVFLYIKTGEGHGEIVKAWEFGSEIDREFFMRDTCHMYKPWNYLFYEGKIVDGLICLDIDEFHIIEEEKK